MENRNPDGTFIKGPGRPKGAINQETRDIKAVTKAIIDWVGQEDRLNEILQDLKTNNPSALLTFLGKVVPKDVNLSNADGSLTPIVILKLPKKEIT